MTLHLLCSSRVSLMSTMHDEGTFECAVMLPVSVYAIAQVHCV